MVLLGGLHNVHVVFQAGPHAHFTLPVLLMIFTTRPEMKLVHHMHTPVTPYTIVRGLLSCTCLNGAYPIGFITGHSSSKLMVDWMWG